MANASVVDELIVKLTLDASQYKKVDAEIDRLVSGTERRAKNRDRERDKRMKDSEAMVKRFGASLRGLALTVGAVLGVGAGVGGLVGAVVALTNFETGLRRATVSTGMSNREMQAWGSTARRLGADAQAGAQAIAELAREQKQFHLTGQAPTLQAFARMGVNAQANTPLLDILSQAQTVYRGAGAGQQQQIESGLAASGVSNDLILLIKSETDVRQAYTRSYAESAEENRKAMDGVSDALESVKNSALGVANALAAMAQPGIEAFAKWASQGASDLSAFNDRVQAAGGGAEGFAAVLDRDTPTLAAALRATTDGLAVMGEVIDVTVYGFQSLYKGLARVFAWIDEKFGALTGGGSTQIRDAAGIVRDAVKWAWGNITNEARREGAAPIGTVTGSAGGARLTPGAQARIAAGELGAVPAGAPRAPGVRPSAQDVMRYLTSRGLSVDQAAALAANIQNESNFDPTAYNWRGGGRGAHGLVQWRGARLTALEQFSGKAARDTPWQTQLDFLLANPYEQHLLRKSFAPGGTVADLGARVSQIYEGHGQVAEDARRGRIAAQLAGGYGGAAGGAAPAGTSITIAGPVTVQANNPTEFIGGIERVSGVQNFNAAVR